MQQWPSASWTSICTAPIKPALPRIVEHLVPGGIIVVDDCVKGGRYDGAGAACREYVEERGLPYDVQAHRLGVIEQAA
jgi:predicted O-methyltransferase YrrM